MTVVVTRNVPDRVRGFLASSMLEVGPGVYTGSRLSVAVRNRIWSVLEDWFPWTDGSIVMVWRDTRVPGGQSVRILGVPPIDLVEIDGIVLARRSFTGEKREDE
ncbi:MAG: type I-E CRISPR-associated endoribonuclease Cas2e [Limnochordia bacterium]|jgi:CRISPR-associated protein Cas2